MNDRAGGDPMGYRSEVVLAFDKSILPKFLDVLAKCEETKRLVFQFRREWNKEFTIRNYGDDDVDCDGHHCITWSSIKWYGDPEFQNIEAFVYKYSDKARFLRIGENAGDHEDFGDFADYDIEIQTHAEIVFL
tara:strand:+ start:1391 stop:1789 length:399 start_codon:yes stop_codon:yes gene_type:complete